MPLQKRRYLPAAIVAAVFLALVLLAWRLYNPPALYRVTFLPPHTYARRLNDHGQVVGEAHEDDHAQPFLWDRTHGIQKLECIGGFCAINNAGQAAGTMLTDPNNEEVFLWEPDKGRTMIGTLGGKRSSVKAMNNRGQIVGICYTIDGSSRGFLWDRETGMKELTTPDGIRCVPVSINDGGEILVVGVRQPSIRPYPWFLLSPNGSEPLNGMPPDTQLQSINADSCVAGIEKSSGPLVHFLLRDKHGTWKRLFAVNGHMSITRLNNRNQIAYTEFAYSRWDHARRRLPGWLVRCLPSRTTESYLWDPARGRISLNRYLGDIGAFHVEDLNNNGCIVGMGTAEDGYERSVLLEPIPERWGK